MHCGPAIPSHLLGIGLEALRGSRHHHPIVLAAIMRLAYTHAFFLATWTVHTSLPEKQTGPFAVLTLPSLRRWLPPPPASYYTSTTFDSLPLSSAWVPGCVLSWDWGWRPLGPLWPVLDRASASADAIHDLIWASWSFENPGCTLAHSRGLCPDRYLCQTMADLFPVRWSPFRVWSIVTIEERLA